MMKRLAVLLLLVALSGGAEAQQIFKAHLLTSYDVDSQTLTYGYFGGRFNDPYQGGIAVGSLITTSGAATTTVAAVTANTLPFASLGVGDVISVNIDGSPNVRVITAKASGDSITVNSNITIATAGLPFVWWKFNSGTAATSGWVDVSNMSDITISVHYVQGDLTSGLDVTWECRVNEWDTQGVTVYPGEADTCGAAGTLGSLGGVAVCTFATAGATADLSVLVGGKWDACRLGVAFHTSDPSDAGANLEQVSAELVGRR